MNESWANTPDFFIIPQEEAVYVYHTRLLPVGHGFNVYRQDGRGAEFILLNDEPIRGIRRTDELQPMLGERYDQVLRYFDEQTASGLHMAIRSKPIERDIASILYPEFAKVLGRLFIDETAPAFTEVAYRIEFVDGTGQPTGVELTGSVFTEPVEPVAPEITNVENRGRWVTMHWNYPQTPRGETDFVIQFYLFRMDERTGEPQLLTDDVIIRNNAQREHFISFRSQVINTTEKYFMTAVTFTGLQSERSQVYEFELIDNIPPAPVTGLNARVSEEQWVSLTWDISREADLAGYHVYRSTDMAEDFTRISEILVNITEPIYSDTTVTGGLTYFYYVRAVDRAGNESEIGDMVMAQVLDLIPPPRPENFSATFNTDLLSVDLTWDMPEFTENFESFIIMRRREDERRPGAYTRVNMQHLTDVIYNDPGEAETGFPEGALYRYLLFSSSKAKNYSDTVSALVEIPLLTPPRPPSSITAINDNGHRINISWNASPSASTENYILYRKKSGEAEFSKLKQVPVNNRFVRDEQLETATEYVYAVAALDRAANESDLSEPDTVFFRNFTPPRSVRNIQAVERDAGVELRWERVAADDLAGYIVYRANSPTGRYQPAHQGVLTETGFFDQQGTANMWYRVRAVDTSGNESRPGSPVRPLSIQ